MFAKKTIVPPFLPTNFWYNRMNQKVFRRFIDDFRIYLPVSGSAEIQRTTHPENCDWFQKSFSVTLS
jgi:hypothetical protein